MSERTLALAFKEMQRLFYRMLVIFFVAGSLVSCATSDLGDSSGTSSSNKSSVPGADDPDRAGSLSPAVGANGAGANVQF